jgi:hypothetical protein
MVGLRTRKSEMRGDGGNHCDKLRLRDFYMQVNLPSPIWQVQVPIHWVIWPIKGRSNSIRESCSPDFSYSTYNCHVHPPSHSVSSTTLPSSRNTKFSHSSQSLHVIIISLHCVQHTPSTAYSEYSVRGSLLISGNDTCWLHSKYTWRLSRSITPASVSIHDDQSDGL